MQLETHDLGCDCAIALVASLRPAILDSDGAALDPAKFTQPLHESRGPRIPVQRRARPQKADGCQLRLLLRACRERPRCRRAAEQRDEFATPQLIELHSVPSQGRIADIELAEVSQELFGATQQPWAGTPAEAPSPSSPRVHSISLPPMSFSPFLDDCHGVRRIADGRGGP